MERICIRVGREGLFLRRLVTEEHVETSKKRKPTRILKALFPEHIRTCRISLFIERTENSFVTCILTVGAFKALRFNCFCFQAVSIKNSIQKQPRFLMAFFSSCIL